MQVGTRKDRSSEIPFPKRMHIMISLLETTKPVWVENGIITYNDKVK